VGWEGVGTAFPHLFFSTTILKKTYNKTATLESTECGNTSKKT